MCLNPYGLKSITISFLQFTFSHKAVKEPRQSKSKVHIRVESYPWRVPTSLNSRPDLAQSLVPLFLKKSTTNSNLFCLMLQLIFKLWPFYDQEKKAFLKYNLARTFQQKL